ncbi:hypothetical protein L198_07228 [Cryptococcus wingfieldii CBS 7118]|uniref:Uncharacterized protein n=1 Tax=Cryptococcus wingfieldii CBS 7118 TaxID=1295528 RepID=A0A1E3ID60_9TREE|nr:hypothetical protein L198_07228 [Cryptococcus wingfieldii CBS 7118]ODN86534.1 hypothetical protein L198_07228 [Cryptococcus wingfieldii CBS 7118]
MPPSRPHYAIQNLATPSRLRSLLGTTATSLGARQYRRASSPSNGYTPSPLSVSTTTNVYPSVCSSSNVQSLPLDPGPGPSTDLAMREDADMEDLDDDMGIPALPLEPLNVDLPSETDLFADCVARFPFDIPTSLVPSVSQRQRNPFREGPMQGAGGKKMPFLCRSLVLDSGVQYAGRCEYRRIR